VVKGSRYSLDNAWMYLRLSYQAMMENQMQARGTVKRIEEMPSRDARMRALAEVVLYEARQLRSDDASADEQPALPHVHPEREP
jgi:hypothetical protein